MVENLHFYTNVWLSYGFEYQTETQICTSREEAIADYNDNVGVFKYSHTKVVEVEGVGVNYPLLSWYSEIDITEFIEKKEKEPNSWIDFDESAEDMKREEEAGIC